MRAQGSACPQRAKHETDGVRIGSEVLAKLGGPLQGDHLITLIETTSRNERLNGEVVGWADEWVFVKLDRTV